MQTRPQTRGMSGRWILPLIALLLPLAPAMATDRPPVPVETSEVRVEPVQETIRAVGTLLANESVIIRPEIAGRITAIAFQEGQAVSKDVVLIRLNDTEYSARVEQTLATLRLNELKHERANNLFQDNMVSQEELDEASARLAESRASLKRDRAILEKTRLRTPFDGLVGIRLVSVGAYVRPGQDLVNLESIDPVKLEFRASERYAAMLRPGQTVEFSVDAADKSEFTGEIYAINPRLDPETRTFNLRARAANPDGILRPGMFARIRIVTTHRDNALTVPEEALFPIGDDLYVYLFEEGRALQRQVQTGKHFDGRVEIQTGLKAADTVISSGHMKIRDGAAVKPLPPGASRP